MRGRGAVRDMPLPSCPQSWEAVQDMPPTLTGVGGGVVIDIPPPVNQMATVPRTLQHAHRGGCLKA